MVKTCVVWGCTNRAGVGDSTIKFYDIQKVITHQGKQTEELSSERRVLWLSQINRANFNPDPNKRHFKVCSDHFISGMNICIFKKNASYVCYRYIFVNSHLKIIVHVQTNSLLSITTPTKELYNQYKFRLIYMISILIIHVHMLYLYV